MIIGPCLTVVTMSAADPNSLTWLPGLTLDLPHHCGGDLDGWVNLLTITGPHLLTLLGYSGSACPFDSETLALPASLSSSAPGFLSSQSILPLLLPDRFFMEHLCSTCPPLEYWLHLLISNGQFNINLGSTFTSHGAVLNILNPSVKCSSLLDYSLVVGYRVLCSKKLVEDFCFAPVEKTFLMIPKQMVLLQPRSEMGTKDLRNWNSISSQRVANTYAAMRELACFSPWFRYCSYTPRWPVKSLSTFMVGKEKKEFKNVCSLDLFSRWIYAIIIRSGNCCLLWWRFLCVVWT